MNLENILNTYGAILIVIVVIKIIYFILLLCKVFDNAKSTYNNEKTLVDIHNNQVIEIGNQRKIIELLSEQNEKLERIANALEQDSEPYIIEKED